MVSYNTRTHTAHAHTHTCMHDCMHSVFSSSEDTPAFPGGLLQMYGGLKMSYSSKGHSCPHCRQVHCHGNKTSSHDGGRYSDDYDDDDGYAGKGSWGNSVTSDETSRPHTSSSSRQPKTMIMLFTQPGSGRGSHSSESYMMSSSSLYDTFTDQSADNTVPTADTSGATPTITVHGS